MSAVLDWPPGGRRALPPARDVAYARGMKASVDDAALMSRYRDGDVAAFETLYRRHNDALYRYLLRLSRHPETAADVFQEVWSNIIRYRARYRPSARLNTFLYRVAHNCFIDHLRRNRRHEGGADVDPAHCAHPQRGPDDAAETSLARDRLRIALESLPDAQRDTFLLHEEAGLTLETIAEITHVSRETAKSRLRYALNKLKDALRAG